MNGQFKPMIKSITMDDVNELEHIFKTKLMKKTYYLHFCTPKDIFIPLQSFLFDVSVLQNSEKCTNFIGNFNNVWDEKDDSFTNPNDEKSDDSDDNPLKNAFVYNAEIDEEDNDDNKNEEEEQNQNLEDETNEKEEDFIEISNDDTETIEYLLILTNFEDNEHANQEPDDEEAEKDSFRSLIDWFVRSNYNEDEYPETVYEALYIAANSNNLSIVEYLLSNGVKGERISKYGTTIFNGAVFKRNYELIDILYDYNVGQTADARQRFPLHIAAKLMDDEMAEYLLQLGADTFVSDWRTFSPLHIAAKNGCIEIIHLLIDYGDSINKRDRYGRTPLHIAALYGQLRSCVALYEDGAAMEAIDKHGLTAMNFATMRKKKKVMKYFDSLGLNNTNMEKDYQNRPKRRPQKPLKSQNDLKNKEMARIIRTLR